jgi:excinuclease UvrABC helicase subunit UvrB
MIGPIFDNILEKKLKTMRKIYLFDLSDLFSLTSKSMFNDFSKSEDEYFPKENDTRYNKTVEESETETHIIKKETWISTDGTSKFTRTYSESKNQKPKVDVKVLESALKEAIEKEEFEKAAQLRDEIKKLKA